jgi:hypothetical protein
MKKFNLIFALIAIVMLVGLTNCKKDTDKDNSTIAKYVGTVNGSFVAQDASIKVNKDLAPDQLVTRNWIMYVKNSPFYGNQSLALVKGNEFITGSAAQQWWSKDGNNPISFAANQAVYSNLTPAEPVRLVMEGKDGSNNVAYLGIVDFDATAAQFPLAVNSVSLGDKLIINADGLTSKPGGSSISISATFQVAPVNVQATETTSQLFFNGSLLPGVSGILNFQGIRYNASSAVTKPVGTGDCVVFDGTASKIQGTIIITITFPPLSSAPGVSGSSTTLTVPAAGPGQYKKIVLTTTKLGWYDSATIGVTDNDITVDETNVSVDGTGSTGGTGTGGTGTGGTGTGTDDQGTLPPVHPSNSLNGLSTYIIDKVEEQLVTSLVFDFASTQASIMTQPIGGGANVMNNGELKLMGQEDLISELQLNPQYLSGPPVDGYSSSVTPLIGRSYIIRYKNALNYVTSNAPYRYGIFYVTSYDVDPNTNRILGFTFNYEGPFTH